MKSPRDVLGEALVELGQKNNKIVVLNADVATPTKAHLFQKEFQIVHISREEIINCIGLLTSIFAMCP